MNDMKFDYLAHYKTLRMKYITAQNKLLELEAERDLIATDREFIEADTNVTYQKMYIERLRKVMADYGQKLIDFSKRYDDGTKKIQVFALLFVFNKPVYQITQSTGLSNQTIYNYKSEFMKDLRELFPEIPNELDEVKE